MNVRLLLAMSATLLFTATLFAQSFPVPVNGVTPAVALSERRPLPYAPVREADIMWQKTVWRVIDVREKMNLPFAYPERPLFTVLTEAAQANKIQLYADDDFTEVLSVERRQSLAGTVDTVLVTDPETHRQSLKVIVNAFDPADIRRYRVKEVWYVDRESSTLKIRILGISPLQDVYDEQGNFRYEIPLYWVYYPGARSVLARENAPTTHNVLAGRSWEDLFESRFFSSHIYRDNNIYDRKISAYLTGRDALLEGEKIDRRIFNFEHDLWTE